VKLVLAALTAWLLIPSATADAATRTFNAVADASAPSTAHGTASRLVVSGRSRSYMRFKVSLPTGATVTGASLRLYATALAPAGTSLSRARNHWSERRLNRKNRPAVTGRRLARDRGSARGWRSLAAGIVGTGPQTFVLSGRTRKRSRYHSREAANGPQLVVSYSTPRSAPAPPATPAGCPVARPQATWRAPGSPPLTDAQAATCVARSGENRPQNAGQNAHAPTTAELAAFRTARDSAGRTPAEYNRNFGYVTGAAARYGLRSTDDLIEWAAYKWGVPENLVRGQMVMESGWSMLQKGDRRDWATPVAGLYPTLAVIDSDSVWESLGIAQIRWRHTVPWNPGVEPLRWQSTAFALDYSQALIRYYFDGYCDWCGAGYAAGNPDGAYRTYVSGSWNDGQWYADGVRSNAASRPWEPIPPA
jgi:hypothetical protein